MNDVVRKNLHDGLVEEIYLIDLKERLQAHDIDFEKAIDKVNRRYAESLNKGFRADFEKHTLAYYEDFLNQNKGKKAKAKNLDFDFEI